MKAEIIIGLLMVFSSTLLIGLGWLLGMHSRIW